VIELSKRMDKEPFVLYMDNLASHRTLALAQICQERGISKCMNIGYCPQFNPIENTFAEVKRVFNKARLSALSNNE
jgi:transposase